jgi:hypothetical protein
MASHDLNIFQNLLKCAETCKKHRKSSVSPKIANNISWESLKSVEPNYAVIS